MKEWGVEGGGVCGSRKSSAVENEEDKPLIRVETHKKLFQVYVYRAMNAIMCLLLRSFESFVPSARVEHDE